MKLVRALTCLQSGLVCEGQTWWIRAVLCLLAVPRVQLCCWILRQKFVSRCDTCKVLL